MPELTVHALDRDADLLCSAATDGRGAFRVRVNRRVHELVGGPWPESASGVELRVDG